MDRGAWRATVQGVAKSRTRWSVYAQQPRTRCTKWSQGIQECLRGSRGRPPTWPGSPKVPASHVHCSPQQIFMPCTEVGISSGSESPIIFLLSCGVSGPLTKELLNSSFLVLFPHPLLPGSPSPARSQLVTESQLLADTGDTKSSLPASRPTIISRAHLRP